MIGGAKIRHALQDWSSHERWLIQLRFPRTEWFHAERWLKSIKSESHGLEFDTFEMHKFSVVYCLISLNHQGFGGINIGKHDWDIHITDAHNHRSINKNSKDLVIGSQLDLHSTQMGALTDKQTPTTWWKRVRNGHDMSWFQTPSQPAIWPQIYHVTECWKAKNCKNTTWL